MLSPALAEIMQRMEALPEEAQNQVVEHLREYLAVLEDELRWDALFARPQDKLEAAARRAKQEIAEGKAEPMNYDKL